MARTRLSGIQVQDGDFFLQSEGDTLSGTLSARIDAKPDTLLELDDTPSSYDNDKYLKSTISGTVWAAVAASGGGGLTWTVISGSTTAENGNGYLINASNNDIVLSLPSSPSEGDTVGFCDFYSAALANDITISGSGSNIFGISEPLIVDVIGAAGTLVYTDDTRGWELTTEIGSVTQTTFNYQNFVDRGDPSVVDWDVTDFTTDATWNNLDCSSIAPSNVIALVFLVNVRDDAVNSAFQMRKNGNTNNEVRNIVRTQVVGVSNDATFIVACDENQVVNYFATNTTFSVIEVTILGWFTEDDQTAVGSGNVYAPSDLTDKALISGDGGSRNAKTTTVMVSDDGEMTNASQPCFLIYPTDTQTNLAIDNPITIVFNNEIFDVGGNFASNAFTAPITGKYLLNVNLLLQQLDTAATYIQLQLITSNRTYYATIDLNFSADADNFPAMLSVLADMDANDTAYVAVKQSGGAQQLDILNYSTFSGSLIC